MYQKYDTLALVNRLFPKNWQNKHKKNPESIGKSSSAGSWMVRAGTAVRPDRTGFAAVLEQATNKNVAQAQSQAGVKTTKFDEYTVQPGDTLWGLSVKKYHVNMRDIVKDNAIENPALIQVGQKLKIRKTVPQPASEVTASWYGEAFQGKPMANGAPFDMYADTIAHKDLPLGTKVELNNPRTGQTITAVVTDRGPYVAGRDVDLSYGLARKLSLVEEGVDKLVMKVL